MEDILEDRRTKGDVCWVLQQCDIQEEGFTPKLLDVSLLDSIKNDPGVLAELIKMPHAEKQEAYKQIDAIFEEMHHNFNTGSVRRIGFALAKIFKQLYDHIYVEVDDIKQVRALPAGVPTLYLPTHRSYVDFLLVSYVCFHYRLPMPVIAAGMDFKSMLGVGELLRNCGAFFIRRRLGGDRLYAAVLRAYVQSLALTSHRPAEFFIEGTRSRSGKALPPRTGLLSAYLDLFHTGRIPDLHIVPISITYDRVIEENLYAYEMLGTPKPRESTGRLVRAVSVLAENYGSVHVRLLAGLSLRGLPPARCCPLAVDVLRRQLAGQRLGAGTLLLAALQLSSGRARLQPLVETARLLGGQLAAARPELLVEEVDAGSVRRVFHVHHSLLRVSSGRLVELRPPAQPADADRGQTKGPSLKEATVKAAMPRIQLQFYVNPLLPHVVGAALDRLAAVSGLPDARGLLRGLMTVEFPTLEGDAPDPVTPFDAGWQDIAVQLIRPYLDAYRVIIRIILEGLPEDPGWAHVQRQAEERCEPHHPATHLCLCRDVIANCTAALLRLDAGTRTTRCGSSAAQWSRGAVGSGGMDDRCGRLDRDASGLSGGPVTVLWKTERLSQIGSALEAVCAAADPRPAARL